MTPREGPMTDSDYKLNLARVEAGVKACQELGHFVEAHRTICEHLSGYHQAVQAYTDYLNALSHCIDRGMDEHQEKDEIPY